MGLVPEFVTSPHDGASGIPDGWCDIVGRGRMGSALAAALAEAGVLIRGPLGRGADASGAAVVILCVPDREIAAASSVLAPGAIVGHVSASADLELLSPHERFGLHPLLSVVGVGQSFADAACAIFGSTPRALRVAMAIADRLLMRAVAISAADRPLYHAAASVASNYLVTLEGMAERLAQHVGLDRSALAPLVRGSIEHWLALGARDALTGPIVRGDEGTVSRQRDAVSQADPTLLPLWDALTAATRALAANNAGRPS